MTNKQFLKDNKCELQVTKILPEQKYVIEDFVVFARGITNHGCNCGIFRVDGGIVLMRNIEEGETIITRENGKYCEKPIREARRSPFYIVNLKNRELIKTFTAA